MKKTDESEYGAEEAARRRDAVLKIMVNTPPQPRSKPASKAKTRPASKGRVHKGKAGR
jgi:hypothetical protein